jgi:hypothetical protein
MALVRVQVSTPAAVAACAARRSVGDGNGDGGSIQPLALVQAPQLMAVGRHPCPGSRLVIHAGRTARRISPPPTRLALRNSRSKSEPGRRTSAPAGIGGWGGTDLKVKWMGRGHRQWKSEVAAFQKQSRQPTEWPSVTLACTATRPQNTACSRQGTNLAILISLGNRPPRHQL